MYPCIVLIMLSGESFPYSLQQHSWSTLFTLLPQMIRHVLLTFFFHILTSWESICVVKCLEFQELYMVLQESLGNADIPHHDKVWEAVINCWRVLFGDVKHNLSVNLNILSPITTNWHQSIVISRAHQFYFRRLGMCQEVVLLGLDSSLDLPWSPKWMP